MSGKPSSEEAAPRTSSSKQDPRKVITVLPKHVVDQIAAGEVVQRPVSVIKEVLENSLDAGSTQIIVKVEQGGLSKLTVLDNGCGISKMDLGLAATRHATSKLSSVDDFSDLQTFGFRGEALASISTVSRLTLTSRTADSPVAFTQTYKAGVPQATQPRPCARKPGTTLIVQDLFYNVPHRLKTYKKRESDEYSKILQVVQHYAIHYPHCGFCLERKHGTRSNLVDVNTSQLGAVRALATYEEKNAVEIQERSMSNDVGACRKDTKSIEHQDLVIAATKTVMSHVLEPRLESHLSYMTSSISSEQPPTDDSQGSTTTKPSDFTYWAEIYFTKPSYKDANNKKTHFVLFLNDRLVDLPSLKRNLEEIYADFVNAQNNKPVLVVNVRVPGKQVDVNVHPSKRQVALMYQEELCQALAKELRSALEGEGHTFAMQTPSKGPIENPYKKTSSLTKKRKVNESAPEEDETPPKRPVSSAKRTPPSQLIRTTKAAPVGAIEPFLVSQPSQRLNAPRTRENTQALMTSSQESNEKQSSQEETELDQTDANFPHKETCPLAKGNLDLSQPGAFSLQCTCAPSSDVGAAILVKRAIVRPKKVIPTKCSYRSIQSLRKRVNKHTDPEWSKQLRGAHFVGVVSHCRSLIQCGEHLVQIHHGHLAAELFYQLTLARFGGATVAQLGDAGVDRIGIQSVIEQTIQFEDNMILLMDERDHAIMQEKMDAMERSEGLLEVNQTNQSLAEQATTCLFDHKEMLEEYFGIRIESEENNSEVFLTALPVLLDGHVPETHGLGTFLLRLATQVDWGEERPCFHGVCKELSKYYSSLPTKEDDLRNHVQHILFPALSYLLLPSTKQKSDGNFMLMTKLSTLYKVFERC